jgi:glutamine amidotransferase
MKVGIINYQAGNLFSIKKIIEDLNYNVSIISNPKEFKNCDKFILPGVGSFRTAMENINRLNFIDEINENIVQKKKLLLGICLGMQIMFENGTENGNSNGLNFFKGKVEHLTKLGCKLTLPHIGWNNIKIKKKFFMFNNINNNSDFYFANNYGVLATDKYVTSKVNYGVEIVSSIAKENLWGVQFHPEKSSLAGKQIFLNFLEW